MVKKGAAKRRSLMGVTVNTAMKMKEAAGLTSSSTKIQSQSKVSRRGKDDDESRMGEEDDEWMQPKILMKPDDQLDLSAEELKEEFTRILTANNPHAPNNIVRYSFKDCCYKMKMGVDQLAIHFSMDGNMLHKESDEGRRQLTRMGLGEGPSEQNLSEMEIPGEEDLEVEGEEDGEKDAPKEVPVTKPPETALRNQFNYSERASQTFNNPYRERGTSTEPPPRTNFSATANQWEIYDAYVEDLERQEKQKEKKKDKEEKDKKNKGPTVEPTQGDEMNRIAKPAKIVERMVNQNTHDEIAQDFKYWEDASDEFKGNEGTLLPLWPFKSDKAKKFSVTAVLFNPKYDDMFAVGHGSYDFLKQSTGLICVYSLKNPSFPEFTYTCESGVMSLDFHPEHPYLMAVGFYDGAVAVYNLREKSNVPQYVSSAKNGKHTDPVWQVYWQENDLDNQLNFFSISSDGRVTCWSLIKNELHNTDIILIRMQPDNELEAGAANMDLACGTCFDFHKSTDYLFLVGTEEGKIHKCSKHYSSQFLDTYNAHHMAVYAVRWNNFHPRVFASCSADWTVKIWDHNYSEPMFTFDLGNSVGDVVWSPYSATVFGAVTDDGTVHIFDLSQEKYEPLCQQSVVQKKKTKVNHLAFNQHYPIIAVGDDRGNCVTLKLSPNLRKCLKDKSYSKENEIAKMEKLLELVREPSSK